MKTADIVIIGSGSLAHGIVYALSQAAPGSLRIAIIGRSGGKVSRMALIANAGPAIFGTRPFFFPLGFPNSGQQPFPRASFAQAEGHASGSLLAVALRRVPWAKTPGQGLIAKGGFGITLPLQLSLAAELSRGAADSESAIVNACYPDCVNVVLDRLGFRTTCGIGNSAIVEAFCRSRRDIGSDDVRVVASARNAHPVKY